MTTETALTLPERASVACRMTRTEIADAINAYKRAKQDAKDRYSDMMRIAVGLVMNQHDAIKSSVVDFLDGYLVASGMAPNKRKSA